MSFVFWVVLSLLAFAGNSVLCRMALADSHIDPISFTFLRLASGALFLIALVLIKHRNPSLFIPSRSVFISALALFVYAIAFSMAYVVLPAGLGALLLFGFVQISMLVWSRVKREPFTKIQWSGFSVAVIGVVWLLNPESNQGALLPSIAMALAGVAWAVYSIQGKGTTDPTSHTAQNFLWSLPMALLVFGGWLNWGQVQLSMNGVILATLSGVVTSGMGYAIWYKVLPRLSVNIAATLQLSVPVIAILFGVMLLNEDITSKLVVASLLVLGGITLVIASRAK